LSWDYDALIAKVKELLPSYRSVYIASNECDFVIPSKVVDLFERWKLSDVLDGVVGGYNLNGRINRDAKEALDKSVSTFTGRRFITDVRGAYGVRAWVDRLKNQTAWGWDGTTEDRPKDPDSPTLTCRPPTPEEKAVLEQARHEVQTAINKANENRRRQGLLPRDAARLVIRNEVVNPLKAEKVKGVQWVATSRHEREKGSTVSHHYGDDRDRVEIHATAKGEIVVKTILEGETPIASAFDLKSPENAISKAREAARRVTAAITARPENLPADPTEGQLAALLDYALEQVGAGNVKGGSAVITFVRENLARGERDKELKAGRQFMNRLLEEAKNFNNNAKG
jgi:hypothetical protein